MAFLDRGVCVTAVSPQLSLALYLPQLGLSVFPFTKKTIISGTFSIAEAPSPPLSILVNHKITIFIDHPWRVRFCPGDWGIE